MKPALAIFLVGLIGLSGILVTTRWVRLVLWLASFPFCCLAILALSGGGIAEPFSAGQMVAFCSVMFWPAIGCAVGEARRIWRRKHQPLEAKENEVS